MIDMGMDGLYVYEPGDSWDADFDDCVGGKLIPEGDGWLLMMDPQRFRPAICRFNALNRYEAVLEAYELMDEAELDQ